MTKISFCILNFYEDWIVMRAISQVYKYVDEILIGDCSKGKDLLPDMIKGLPKCRIVPDLGLDEDHLSWMKWRNYVQSFAKGDWIFWQDPDEIYPLRFLKDLRRIVETSEVEGLALTRVAYENHKRIIERNREPKVRLWRNLKTITWQGEIHESPRGFKTCKLLEVDYAHDVNWLPSFPQRIYKLKRQEKRGNLIERLKVGDLDPYRKFFPDNLEDEAFESRE